MKRYLENNYVEAMLKKESFIDDKIVFIIKQRMIGKVIESILKGAFDNYGEVIQYIVDKKELNSQPKLSNKELKTIESPIVVIKRKNKILIENVEEIRDKYFNYIATKKPIASIENKEVFVSNYVFDEEFNSIVENIGLDLFNKKECDIAEFTNNYIEKKIKELTNRADIEKMILNYKKSIIVDKFDFDLAVKFLKSKFEYMKCNDIKSLSNEDYLAIKRDLFNKKMISDICSLILNAGFNNIRDAINYCSKNINDFKKNIDSRLSNILVKKYLKKIVKHMKEEECILENISALAVYENLLEYNSSIIDIIKDINEALDNISSSTGTCILSNGSLVKYTLGVGWRVYTSYRMFKYKGEELNYCVPAFSLNGTHIIDNPKEIDGVSVTYKNKIIYSLSEEKLNIIKDKIAFLIEQGIVF